MGLTRQGGGHIQKKTGSRKDEGEKTKGEGEKMATKKRVVKESYETYLEGTKSERVD